MKRKIAFKTLGCRLNQYETNSLVSQFNKGNYKIVNFNEIADIYIVNTCTVTGQSDHRSRNAISKAFRKNKDSILIVTGCMANSDKEKIEQLGTVTYVIENERKSLLYSIVESHFNGELITAEHPENSVFNYLPSGGLFRTRSLVKIHDGCNNYCSFCIVPFVRGNPISRSPDDIVENVKKLVELDFHEIVVTGVNIGRYNYKGINFEEIMEDILNVPGDFRVRISSLEPEGIGKKFPNLFTNPKLCPHLHLCLQNGTDNILQKMGRKYSVYSYMEIINSIKSRVPDFNFTTDIIVGFPGETEKDFLETCKIVKDIGFSHIHTFKFSVRKGTKAAKMEDQINEKIKTERSKIIRDISLLNKRVYREKFIGKKQNVLVEKKNSKGYYTGYGEHYMPVSFKAGMNCLNKIQTAKITGISRGEDLTLFGEVD